MIALWLDNVREWYVYCSHCNLFIFLVCVVSNVLFFIYFLIIQRLLLKFIPRSSRSWSDIENFINDIWNYLICAKIFEMYYQSVLWKDVSIAESVFVAIVCLKYCYFIYFLVVSMKTISIMFIIYILYIIYFIVYCIRFVIEMMSLFDCIKCNVNTIACPCIL